MHQLLEKKKGKCKQWQSAGRLPTEVNWHQVCKKYLFLQNDFLFLFFIFKVLLCKAFRNLSTI